MAIFSPKLSSCSAAVGTSRTMARAAFRKPSGPHMKISLGKVGDEVPHEARIETANPAHEPGVVGAAVDHQMHGYVREALVQER